MIINTKGRCTGSRRILFCLAFALAVSAPAGASTYLDIGDDAYVLLSRLEAEGLINDALLSTKPLSRKEIVRLALEAEKNAAERSEFIKNLVQALKQRVKAEEYLAGTIKPLDSVYARYLYTSADVLTRSYPGAVREKEQAFNYNNDGDLYEQGSNYRIGLTSRLENFGPLSIYLNPEYRQDNDTAKGVLKKAYAVLGFSWIDIVAGKDSQWWGPGHHGALLLSNNAEPLTIIKFTGPGPQVLPWVFKYLGPFQYNVFLTKLEKDRSDFPEPYFWGMRFAFKPHPVIEIGVERTGLLGGSGRSSNANTWLDSLLGKKEHAPENPGDQRVGYDVTLTLPFRFQPVQVYWEQAGEENWPRDVHHTDRYASLCGVYLPRIFGLTPLDLRAEYAQNHVRNAPYVWYAHGTYVAGYTYQGMVIGHHMGTESRDIFLELSYLVPERSARFMLSYDREEHTIPGSPLPEITDEIMASAVYGLSRYVELTASYGIGTAENAGTASGENRTLHEIGAGLKYLF